jgi:hypothetical protein
MILKLPIKRTAMHELIFGSSLVGLLSVILGVSAVAASFTARGIDIEPHATLGALMITSIGLAVLSRVSNRLLLLASTLAAIHALATTLPIISPLPPAIPLALIVLSAAMVATELRLLTREELQSLRGKRLRRADFVARALRPGKADNLATLEKEVSRRRPAAHIELGGRGSASSIHRASRPTPARHADWCHRIQRKATYP